MNVAHNGLHARLVENVDGDRTQSASIDVRAVVLDHELRVRAADAPGVGLRAPRAVPVEVADLLVVCARVNEVEVALRARGGVRPPAGAELERLVRVND